MTPRCAKKCSVLGTHRSQPSTDDTDSLRETEDRVVRVIIRGVDVGMQANVTKCSLEEVMETSATVEAP